MSGEGGKENGRTWQLCLWRWSPRRPARPDVEPDPEVPERARQRRFRAGYKQRILTEYEGLGKTGKGALLRREGLDSQVHSWRWVVWMPNIDCGPVAGQSVAVFVDEPMNPRVLETTLFALVRLDFRVQFKSKVAHFRCLGSLT